MNTVIWNARCRITARVFHITDPMGVEHELPLDVFCMDFEAPTLRAGINGTLLHVEANDALSGIAAVFVNDELYTTLEVAS